MRGHFASQDDFFPPDKIAELEQQLKGMGKDCTFTVHPGTGHAFANEDNPLGTHDLEASGKAWDETLEFFRERL